MLVKCNLGYGFFMCLTSFSEWIIILKPLPFFFFFLKMKPLPLILKNYGNIPPINNPFVLYFFFLISQFVFYKHRNRGNFLWKYYLKFAFHLLQAQPCLWCLHYMGNKFFFYFIRKVLDELFNLPKCIMSFPAVFYVNRKVEDELSNLQNAIGVFL